MQQQQLQQGQGQGQLQSALGQANSPSAAAAADSWGWLDDFEHKQQAERLPGEYASLYVPSLSWRRKSGTRERATLNVSRFLPVSLYSSFPVALHPLWCHSSTVPIESCGCQSQWDRTYAGCGLVAVLSWDLAEFDQD